MLTFFLTCPLPQDAAPLRCFLQQRASVQVPRGVWSRGVRHDLQRHANSR